MADGTSSAAVEVRPLPSLEEFARFLFDRPGAQERTARHTQRRLLGLYASAWANYEGTPNSAAQQQADALFDELTMTAVEQQAEADFSADDGR